MKILKKLIKTTILLCAVLGLSACKITNNLTNNKNIPLRSGEARYTVTFIGDWSKTKFPKNYPSNAHFSPMIIVNHSDQVNFWKMGQPATPGVEELAETGKTNTFIREINQQKSKGKAQNYIQLPKLSTGTSQASGTLIVSENYPEITALSMLAPSPDWVVGVEGVDLFRTNEWQKTETIKLFVYDAGTEEGSSFSSNNADTRSGIIEKLTTAQTNTDFSKGKHRDGTYVATLKLTLVEQK